MTDSLDTIVIPERAIRAPEAGVVSSPSDNTDHLRHFAFDPVEEHRLGFKQSAQFTGIHFIPRGTVVSWVDNTYLTRHAPGSKTADLMPNNVVEAQFTARETRDHLNERIGFNYDGRKRGLVFLDQITGFDDMMGEALQFLCLPLIPPRIVDIERSLRAREGRALDEMAEMSRAEIASVRLSDTRKVALVEKLAAAVAYLRRDPVASLGVTVREAWPSFNAALAAMIQSCQVGQKYAKAHAQRSEYEFAEAVRNRPGKNEIDDYDLKIYRALGQEAPDTHGMKTAGLVRAQGGGAALPFDPSLPTKNCMACYGMIPAPAVVCLHCGTPQSAAGLPVAVASDPEADKALEEMLARERPPADPLDAPAPGIAAGNLAPPETTTIRSVAKPSAASLPPEKFQIPGGGVSLDDFK